MKKWFSLFAMASLLTMVGCAEDPVCGDGKVDETEACDDGNVVDGDGCSATCLIEVLPSAPVCGDGKVEGNEACDDGNKVDGDGCNSRCQKENGSQPPAPATPVCGDGKKEGNEACDDGNKVDGDGCNSRCQVETPSAGTCPQAGSACSVENDMKCCDDNALYCIPNESGKLVWNVWNCQEYSENVGFETHCHSVTNGQGAWAECTNECTAEDLDYIMDYTSDCTDGKFEIWICEKTDENKYALMGGYYLNSLCWLDSTKLVCNADEVVEEVACANCEDTESGAVCQ